jgi:hypothetical protein
MPDDYRPDTSDTREDMRYLVDICIIAMYIMDAVKFINDPHQCQQYAAQLQRIAQTHGMRHLNGFYTIAIIAEDVIRLYGGQGERSTTAAQEFKQLLNETIQQELQHILDG